MEITWHDDTCFTIKSKNKSLIINPHREAKGLKGEIVLTSLKGEIPTIEGVEKVFDWPGEYEVKNISIHAFRGWTKSKSKEEESGKGDPVLIFCFDFEGVKICHLGELGHVLTSEMVKQIGNVDILMIKVGEGSNLDTKKVTEIIEAIEPRAVIPMGKHGSVEALKDLGVDKIEAVDKFVINAISELPEDKMQYIVLNKSC